MTANDMRKLMESCDALIKEAIVSDNDPFYTCTRLLGLEGLETAITNWMDGADLKEFTAFMKQELGIEDEDDLDEQEDDFDWQSEMETGIIITDNTRGGYDVSAEGKFIDNFAEWDEAMNAVTQWMKQHQYFPNVFFVNDHGNVTHIDKDGNEINSIVEFVQGEEKDDDSVLYALQDAYTFITQPTKMSGPKEGPTEILYRTHDYNRITSKLRDAIKKIQPTMHEKITEGLNDKIDVKYPGSYDITITLSAADWQLFESMKGADQVANTMNKVLMLSVNAGKTPEEVWADMMPVMSKFGEFGARDSEPEYVLTDVLNIIYNTDKGRFDY